MTDVFDTEDYRSFVKSYLEALPKKGHGQYKRMAEHLGVSSVVISQIFGGDRHITPEQSLPLADFLGLRGLKKDYFIQCVHLARAGTHELQSHYRTQLQQIRETAKDLKKVLPQDVQLSDQEKAVFYSNWIYSGVRLLSSLDGYGSLDAIAERLDLPRTSVARVVDFLIAHGLCVENEGQIGMGPNRIHLEAKSPFVKSRQMSWRLKAFEAMDEESEEYLFYTAPMSIDAEKIPVVRQQLVKLFEEVSKIVVSSKPTALACLNVDWFRF